MEADIVVAALLIGCTTFTLSAIGVKVGAMFGDKYRAVSERIWRPCADFDRPENLDPELPVKFGFLLFPLF